MILAVTKRKIWMNMGRQRLFKIYFFCKIDIYNVRIFFRIVADSTTIADLTRPPKFLLPLFFRYTEKIRMALKDDLAK